MHPHLLETHLLTKRSHHDGTPAILKTIWYLQIIVIDCLMILLLMKIQVLIYKNDQQPSRSHFGLSMDELRRAYTARLSEMEQDMKEVKEQLGRSIVMAYGKKKHKSGPKNGRGIRVGGQHPQYNGTDAVNDQQVMAYAGDILSPT